MIEIHELTADARKLALVIQAALDSSNYKEAKELLINIVERVDDATAENLTSGATFTIKDPNNVSSTGNSLLHVALLALQDGGDDDVNVMEKLLELGVNHSAELHVNSIGLTPIEYADKYFREDSNVIGLRNAISDYYHSHTTEYDEYLIKLVKEEVENNRIKDNKITVDIGPIVWQNEERSMFNSSESISENIYAFIDLSQCPGIVYSTEGTMITFDSEDNNDIALLAQVKDT